MSDYHKTIFLFVAFVCFFITGIEAQDNYSKKFSDDSWREVREGLHYSSMQEELKKHQQMRDVDSENATAGEKPKEEYQTEERGGGSRVISLPAGGQTIMYIIFIVVLLVILYFFLKNLDVRNRTIRYDRKVENLEDIEENILETDLERLLKENISKGNFLLAIRLLYLTIIKSLSEKKLIEWHKDKTNQEYLFELANKEMQKNFEKVTLLFEWAWYGDVQMDEKIYSQLEPKFKDFQKNLDQIG